MRDFYEFFAGGGMARAGLGAGWRCAFANDFDARKAAIYARNWGDAPYAIGDVAALASDDLPGRADLAWASFPCQDLSLAGGGAGFAGARSGAFWGFWRLIEALRREARAPRLIALENVVGALSARGGRDFAAIAEALVAGGYRLGALVIDAKDFVPQSRPRLFVIALDAAIDPHGFAAPTPLEPFATKAVQAALARAAPRVRDHWLWWRLPRPPLRKVSLAELIEHEPSDAPWRASAETERLLALMNDAHRAKVEAAKKAGRRMIGALYRRTRPDGQGGRIQRAEVRFDDVAGCLRTPAGGSSRQILLSVEGELVRSRLLSPREAARLMGLDDDYVLPDRANDAYHLLGDGVVAPVVRHLAQNLFAPLLGAVDGAKGRRAA